MSVRNRLHQSESKVQPGRFNWTISSKTDQAPPKKSPQLPQHPDAVPPSHYTVPPAQKPAAKHPVRRRKPRPTSPKRVAVKPVKPELRRALGQLLAILESSKFHPPKLQPPKFQAPKLQPPQLTLKLRKPQWRLSLLWVIAPCVSAGVGLMALLWLTSLPPLPDCQKVTAVSSDTNRLYCAREAARSGDLTSLTAAVNLVKDWSPEHPLYSESQRLMTGWSKSILAIARQKFDQTDLPGALEAANRIPKNSTVYEDAQAAIADWKEQWKQGEEIYATAQEAIKNQEWGWATDQILALGHLNNAYWSRQRMNELTSQIFLERSSWQLLRQARKAVKSDRNAAQLAQGISLVIQVNPKTYVWADAKTELQKWSNALAQLALKRWKAGDTNAAIALGQQIPPDLQLDAEAKDLVRYSYAQKLASWDPMSQITPSLAQGLGLREAIAALKQISSGSIFYANAQSQIQNWQAQLEDLQKLQTANAIASLGQRLTFDWAIDQAKQIGSDRPRRLQAQSLIAFWTQEIERMEDMPLLVHARDMAEPGTIEGFQKAIQAALRIPEGRALWQDAQKAIADWTDQIQTIEDKPILTEARALAKQGKLREAIRKAAQIGRGRALYAEAKTARDGWQAEIDRVLIAEDRKILNEANALAARQRLSQAIDVASQIGPGRPLYGEARGAIAQWQNERDAIWQTWQDEQQYDSGEYSEPAEPEVPAEENYDSYEEAQ